MDDKIQEITNALYKKAVGYSYEEVIKEFVVTDEDGEKLVKKKQTTKNVPPDISASKMFLEIIGEQNNYQNLSDEQLDQEIKKLKILLQNMEEDDEN